MKTRPTPKNETVTAQMKAMPRKSTGPEVVLRRALFARGLRFRLHNRNLPGTPDIVLPGAKIAVFVDGCFWHKCPKHGSLPKNNRDWWSDKLTATKARDRKKDRELRAVGWLPIHVWEHTSPDDAADEIAETWAHRS